MTHVNPYLVRPLSLGEHPLYATLVSFPIAFFAGALATDIMYWRSANIVWQNFSAWLLFGGLVIGGLAAVVALFYMLVHRGDPDVQPTWPYLIGGVVVLVLALINSFIHAGDGWTAVVPYGIVLSALTVVAMLVTGWFGGTMFRRQTAGVYRHV